jgi:type IV secretory pathway TraG/TraD family ATPase VirD4
MGSLTITLQRLIYSFMMFFNRIIASISHNKQLHNARFAHPHELSSLLSSQLQTETSLLLGVNRFNQVLRVRPTKTRRELGNLLIVAPTRGGKGLLAVSQLLTWPASCVVNDIKGDLHFQTAGYRSTLGPVFVIDPTGVGDRYDPLMGKHTEDELFSSATHLLHKPDEGEGAIFTQRATVMLTQLLLAAKKEGYPPLPFVRRLIRDGLLACSAKLDAISPELATQFLDVEFNEADFSDRFLLSAWGTLSARMRPLLTETVIRSLAGGDFQARDLMTSSRPITVYLRWPERDLLALSPLVRLLWGSMIDELITTYDKKQGDGCRPVLLLVDEAGRTALPMLSDHATTVVGRGISLWIACQSLYQLNSVYGRARAHVLRDNMDSALYYRPADQDTADYLERSLGRRSDYAQSYAVREGTKESQGFSEQGVPLMTAQEIKQLKDHEIIGFHRSMPAFKAFRMDWRNHPLLVQRRRIPPPELKQLPQLENILPTTVWQRAKQSTSYIDPDSNLN